MTLPGSVPIATTRALCPDCHQDVPAYWARRGDDKLLVVDDHLRPPAGPGLCRGTSRTL